MQPGIFEVLFAVLVFPIQLVNFVVTSLLNTIVFDFLQLGPHLPIGG